MGKIKFMKIKYSSYWYGCNGKSCLALNMANHNFKVAVYNYTPDLTEAFVKNHPHDNITAFYDVKSLVEGMTRPRKFFIMVTAGKQ